MNVLAIEDEGISTLKDDSVAERHKDQLLKCGLLIILENEIYQMLEYLGDKLFTTKEEYNIFGSVAGWDYKIEDNKVVVEAQKEKGCIVGAVQCEKCKRTFINSTVETSFCELSDSESDSEPGNKGEGHCCPRCKESAKAVQGGCKIPNIRSLNLVKLLEESALKMVVPYGDSRRNPLETRKSYCKALKVYLVITPYDKEILDQFGEYLTKMETTESSDFDNIAKETSSLKSKISKYLEKSPFSVWRRIWLLHERWVAKDLVYLSVSNKGKLEMTETSDLNSKLEQFCEEVIKHNSSNQKLCCFCKDLIFLDETILSQRTRKSPHLKYISENYKTVPIDGNLRLIIHSFNVHGTAASTVTLSKALSTCGTNVDKPIWESEVKKNQFGEYMWLQFKTLFIRNVSKHISSRPQYCKEANKYDLVPVILDLTAVDSIEAKAEDEKLKLLEESMAELSADLETHK